MATKKAIHSDGANADTTREPAGKFSPAAIPVELWQLSKGLVVHASFGLPWRLARAVLVDSSLVPWNDAKVFSLVGDSLLKVIDAWGPLYGKAAQIILSRLGEGYAPLIESLKLDRVYGEWPALSWLEAQLILDEEIPRWRNVLKIDPVPLGVASMSQVHAAEDMDGKRWVVKMLKPNSVRRLRESINALDSAVTVAEPFAVTRISRRFLADIRDLCSNLKNEMNLEHERQAMLRVQELVRSKRQKSLYIPALHSDLGSQRVIVMERLVGTKLSDIVSGRASVPDHMRKSLAKNLLSELLIQIFEWGFFHADPHAGNLMLLADGSIGLYDWGLAGELFDADRLFIAGILKSIMAVNIEALIDVLVDMGRETYGKVIERERVRRELHKLIDMVQTAKAKGGETPSFQKLIEAALEAADRLGIPLPNGLVLMAKSLLTIEGLARGIDADVSFARAAGPVLFRASNPGLQDVMMLAKQLPRMIGYYFKSK